MNFSLILLILVVVTGILWLFDRCYARKKRLASAKAPIWVEFGSSLFPVILVVFLLRSFVAEPFKIPSGSMNPTLIDGDFILVNKWAYGLRFPVFGNKFYKVDDPKHGDIVVFHYPAKPSVDFIKRVIGLPGDKVEYYDKRLRINGQLIDAQPAKDFFDPDAYRMISGYQENLMGKQHQILINPMVPNFLIHPDVYPHQDQCQYNEHGFECVVPKGHYFVLGDNRDNSRDSRYWGFVPDKDLVGRAFFIWFNWKHLKRIGHIE